MILADTSVLIAYQRTADPKIIGVFRTQPVAICGITRAEMRCGVRTPAELITVQTFLATFQTAVIPDHVWDDVGVHLAAMRAAGLPVPFPDLVIATVAIANGTELWARDKHFVTIQGVLPALRLFKE